MTGTVIVKILHQGDAEVGHGYSLKRGENVAAFFIDVFGIGRCHPICVSETDGCPSMTLETGLEDHSNMTEICFPEFEGWRVHSCKGGKTLAVCLVKENYV